MTKNKPETPMKIYKKSTLLDKKGNVKLEWVKTEVDYESQFKLWDEYITKRIEEIKPAEKTKPKTRKYDSNILNFYPLADLHLGMLCHKLEVTHGLNCDLHIAEDWIKESITNLIENSPNAETGLLVDLGDVLESSDDSNRSRSGNVLSVDGRHFEVFQRTTDLFIWMVKELLKKHKKVVFIGVPGNHSELIGAYLKIFLKGYFRNEPRFEIRDGHRAQEYYVFGKTILGFSHGHLLKPSHAPEVLAFDCKEYFGDSIYRYFHFGHFHKQHIDETPLATVEVHKNLLPTNTWANGMGFRGTFGEMKCITYSDENGEISRTINRVVGANK